MNNYLITLKVAHFPLILQTLFFPGYCKASCDILSSGTASLHYGDLLEPCTCQCNPEQPIFREDLQICVNDIHGEFPKVAKLVYFSRDSVITLRHSSVSNYSIRRDVFFSHLSFSRFSSLLFHRTSSLRIITWSVSGVAVDFV